MKARQVVLAPSIAGDARFARDFDAFLKTPPEWAGARATALRSDEGSDTWRVAPRVSASSHGPSAADVSMTLKRFHSAGLHEAWRARFTHPRSESMAEREWNLLCHLRASGVSTPEPLAVGRARGGFFAQRSFLLTRDLTGMRPLRDWLADSLDRRATAHIAKALGLFLLRVFRARTLHPNLTIDALWVSVPRVLKAAPSECDETPRAARFGSLPEVALTDVRGARIVGELDLDARIAMLQALLGDEAIHDRRFVLRVLRAALPKSTHGDEVRRRKEGIDKLSSARTPQSVLAAPRSTRPQSSPCP